MLSSIHPLGERARNARWHRTVIAHVAGAAVGGALIGAVAGTVGLIARVWIDESAALVLVAVAALAAALHELGVIDLGLPSWSRQVNEDWLTLYRDWVYGAGYGFQLGLGVVTIITSPATHLLLLVALLTGTPTAGAIVGTVYGAGRGLSVLTARGINTPDRLVGFHRTMNRWAAPVRRVSAAVLLATGAAAAAVVIG